MLAAMRRALRSYPIDQRRIVGRRSSEILGGTDVAGFGLRTSCLIINPRTGSPISKVHLIGARVHFNSAPVKIRRRSVRRSMALAAHERSSLLIGDEL